MAFNSDSAKKAGKRSAKLRRIYKQLASGFTTHTGRPKHATRNGQLAVQGSGYLIPSNISKADWAFLVQTWNTRLKNSGFNDYETRDSDNHGFFTHMFVHDSKVNPSRNDFASSYKQDVDEYYRLLRLFYYQAPRSAYERSHYKAHRFLLSLRMHGTTYPDIVALIRSGKAPSYIPTTRSIYWAHYHMEKIDACVRAWIDSNPEVLAHEESELSLDERLSRGLDKVLPEYYRPKKGFGED